MWTKSTVIFTAAALLGQCPRAWAGTRLPPRHERCMTSRVSIPQFGCTAAARF